jgi:hypothetical protein
MLGLAFSKKDFYSMTLSGFPVFQWLVMGWWNSSAYQEKEYRQ